MPSSPKPGKPEHYRHGGADRTNLPTEQTSRYMEEADRAPIAYPPPPPPPQISRPYIVLEPR